MYHACSPPPFAIYLYGLLQQKAQLDLMDTQNVLTTGTRGRAGPISWPARSPDLTPLDFWLWGYLKDHVYGQQLSTLQQLRDAIKDELEAIPPIMVYNTVADHAHRKIG